MAYIFITTKGKTNWRYILIIVILALIVIGETLYLLKQEEKISEIKFPEKVVKDETANWKTYTSTKMGFSIKYPLGWEPWPEEVRGDSVGVYINKMSQDLYSGINVIRGPLTPEETQEFNPEEILNKYEKEIIDKEFPSANKEVREEILVDGIGSTKFCGVTQEYEEQYCDVVVILNEDETLFIRCFSEEQECSSTFNQMLSTFRFLE